MAHKINISVQGSNGAWRTLLPNIRARVGQAARAALAEGADSVSLTIQLSDDATIRALNADFRGKDKPTNVLSFPSGEWPPAKGANEIFLGDIILARETIQREAAEQGKAFTDHLTHLVVHGVLHLLGHDHEVEAEAEKMERLEIEILSSLAIANPYLLP